ncbi:helix-turn-helix transcriptional regulator [Nocardiopsis tropica]|uniref:Helix-turn-helix transcriptional regulator n=1 Tax=Nocardiopsis tropica TaxID=109330 RepID=A0ABU7KWR4_9ACTN|nr:helix-turn-helix transcriptional regulator [Nocardiopsis umidischolae]MEE2053760.1 helix-turn-helix transcriptional regulator [Nocardiopsis umidischolae]
MTDYRTARVSLGARLRELRGEAGLSGRTLATRAGWHPSKVSRLEHGRQTASAEDLRLWASVCGRPDTADALVAQRRSLETHYTSWRRRLAAGNQARQQNAVDLESRSRRFRIFETVCVPGILQTPDYARHMISRAVGLHGAPADMEAGVRKRMDRRRFLDDRNKTFQTLLWEPALRMRQCPLDVLTEQLDALAGLVREGKGGIGIVPLSAALTTSPMHGFWIYDDDLVLVETISAELCLTDGDAVDPYRRVFAELSRTAVYGGGAERFIRAVRRSLTTAPSRERSPFSRPEE